MKFLKFIPFFSLLLFLGACNDGKREADDVDDVEEEMMVEDNWDSDAAMGEWRDSWNANDSTGLRAATANDAVLFLEGKAHRDDSITSWINNSSSWMKDLQTTTVMKNKGENFAYEAGTYTHMTTANDTMQMSGTYTVIWERMGDDEWKIKLMDISPEVDLPPMPGTEEQ
jgi:ketosteroid isomerase-like protein